jgi:ATP-binding cassette, subfamily F, member 3
MLQINDLTLRVAGRPLIENANVSLPEGARVGFVARNGTGKTSLFKAIFGDVHPDDGTLHLPRNARLGRVAQEAPSGPEPLIKVVLAADHERARLLAEADKAIDPARIADIQNRLVDIDAYSAPARAARILSGLGFDEDAQQRPCSSFSGGWRMRVALAAVLFSEPDLLLLDEPTNHLDLEGTLWLQDYLARYPRTVLVISHDRDLLDASVDHILHLNDRRLTLYKGNYTSFDRQRREKLLLDQKAQKKQAEERARLEAFVARFKAKASKASQAQSRVKRLEKMEPIQVLTDNPVTPFRIGNPPKPIAPPMLVLENASVGYGDKAVLRRMNLVLGPEDRVGLLGANGNGKSTLLKLICADLPLMDGIMRRPERLVVGYFSQHTLDILNAQETPCQHVRRKMPDAPEAQIRARTAQIGFSGERADVKVSLLSGGEKARLAFGMAVFEPPHLLILDEPTNHLDIDSREALVEALSEYQGAVILVSHDRHMLDSCADELVLVADGTIRAFDGDIDDYRRLLLDQGRESESLAMDDNRVSKADARRQAAEKRASLAPLRKKIQVLEVDMQRFERQISECDEALAKTDSYGQDTTKVAKFAKTRNDAVIALAKAEEEWLLLSAQYDELMISH